MARHVDFNALTTGSKWFSGQTPEYEKFLSISGMGRILLNNQALAYKA